MPVSEMQRTELVNRLVTVLGEESTETLMQCILPEGRDQFATKDDLKVLESTLRGELNEFNAEVRAEFAELRGEIAEHRAENRAEFAELRAYIDSSLAKQTRLNIMMFAAFLLTNWGLVLPFLIAS